LPSDLRRELSLKATEAVRSRLLSCAPPHLFEEIRSAVAAVSAEVKREMSKVRDFTMAKRFVASLNAKGELNEAALLGFRRALSLKLGAAPIDSSAEPVQYSVTPKDHADGRFK
jgi:hypothetical protein